MSTGKELSAIIASISAGQRANIELIRDGKKKYFTVTLAKKKDEGLDGDHNREKKEIGIEITDLNSDIARRFGVKKEYGVLLTDVADGSLAQKADAFASHGM